jgi:DNA adenine methylase/adenine-specific DNA-methyltransferase
MMGFADPAVRKRKFLTSLRVPSTLTQFEMKTASILERAPRQQSTFQVEQSSFWQTSTFPPLALQYPKLRYMGSKSRLLPWIHEVLCEYRFTAALDAFSGTGCVSFLLKAMGKEVVSNDFLLFSHHLSKAAVENKRYCLSDEHVNQLLMVNRKRKTFVEDTFSGIFYTAMDLRFLDNLWANLPLLPTDYHRALAVSALVRSCLKRQPRGVFTVSGDPEHYKDGRRDLKLSLEEHFQESVSVFNALVFDNGRKNRAVRSDIFKLEVPDIDLVYMDPPYVPRADDNCYIKRYHFLEGLASYWTEEGTEILEDTKVKKIPKRYTPFSYRKEAEQAFDALFRKFCESTIVLSYSSNGFPDLDVLVSTMKKYKGSVVVYSQDHRYHFGTHRNVASHRASVEEYLIVGTQ